MLQYLEQVNFLMFVPMGAGLLVSLITRQRPISLNIYMYNV